MLRILFGMCLASVLMAGQANAQAHKTTSSPKHSTPHSHPLSKPNTVTKQPSNFMHHHHNSQGDFPFFNLFGNWGGQTQTAQYHGGVGPRPSRWCGWQMRQMVGSDPGPDYNLARNWAHWGSAGPAGVGAVVVWSHHVGKIVGQENGQWLVESGNDGHAVRTRARSLAGVIAIRWG